MKQPHASLSGDFARAPGASANRPGGGREIAVSAAGRGQRRRPPAGSMRPRARVRARETAASAVSARRLRAEPRPRTETGSKASLRDDVAIREPQPRRRLARPEGCQQTHRATCGPGVAVAAELDGRHEESWSLPLAVLALGVAGPEDLFSCRADAQARDLACPCNAPCTGSSPWYGPLRDAVDESVG